MSSWSRLAGVIYFISIFGPLFFLIYHYGICNSSSSAAKTAREGTDLVVFASERTAPFETSTTAAYPSGFETSSLQGSKVFAVDLSCNVGKNAVALPSLQATSQALGHILLQPTMADGDGSYLHTSTSSWTGQQDQLYPSLGTGSTLGPRMEGFSPAASSVSTSSQRWSSSRRKSGWKYAESQIRWERTGTERQGQRQGRCPHAAAPATSHAMAGLLPNGATNESGNDDAQHDEPNTDGFADVQRNASHTCTLASATGQSHDSGTTSERTEDAGAHDLPEEAWTGSPIRCHSTSARNHQERWCPSKTRFTNGCESSGSGKGRLGGGTFGSYQLHRVLEDVPYGRCADMAGVCQPFSSSRNRSPRADSGGKRRFYDCQGRSGGDQSNCGGSDRDPGRGRRTTGPAQRDHLCQNHRACNFSLPPWRNSKLKQRRSTWKCRRPTKGRGQMRQRSRTLPCLPTSLEVVLLHPRLPSRILRGPVTHDLRVWGPMAYRWWSQAGAPTSRPKVDTQHHPWTDLHDRVASSRKR